MYHFCHVPRLFIEAFSYSALSLVGDGTAFLFGVEIELHVRPKLSACVVLIRSLCKRNAGALKKTQTNKVPTQWPLKAE